MLNRRLWAGALLLLGACDANQLYLAYQTNLGIHAAVNPSMTEGILMIGYRRDFAAVVPRSVDPATSAAAQAPRTATGRDAMSALVCSDLEVEGIWLRQYVEQVAIGQAARNFAMALRGQQAQAQQFFSCFRGEEATP